jgi:hypothetical protein
MANQAARMPAKQETSTYDVGRAIALWVSAFEILVHPGDDGRSNMERVIECLDQVNWLESNTRRRLYRKRPSKSGSKRHRAVETSRERLASWLYRRVHSTRNDFLHGNPLTGRELVIPQSKRPLWQFAAPLYRLALTGFLGLAFNKPPPTPTKDPVGTGRWISEKMAFEEPQAVFERSLMRARQPAEIENLYRALVVQERS